MDDVSEQNIHIGDRVRIREDRWPLIGRVDQVGTVVELFRAPRDSCLVRVDGDTKRNREWFFYWAEITISDV
jgi:hypothetical protein